MVAGAGLVCPLTRRTDNIGIDTSRYFILLTIFLCKNNHLKTIPSTPSDNQGAPISIATVPDLEQLLEFARRTFYETWRPVNTHEDLMDFLDSVFVPEKVLPELRDNAVFTYLLMHSGRDLAGYAKLRRDSIFIQMPSARLIELEKFYFDKRFHGSGLASGLLDRILEIAKHENMEWICLGVDINNHRAINFYSKYGFEVFGEKSFRVGKQVDTDQLMRLKIN